MRSSAWKEIAAVRRQVGAKLEHELVSVAQREPSWIARHADAVSVETYGAVKAQQPGPPQRFAPDTKEVAQARRALESDDTGRVSRPEPAAATCGGGATEAEAHAAQTNRCGDDDDTPVREELNVHPPARFERRQHARPVGPRRRLIARTDADRDRQQSRRYHQPQDHHHPRQRPRRIRITIRILSVLALASLTGLLAGCGASGSSSITIQAARTYHLARFGPTTGIKAGKPTLISFTIVQPDGKSLTSYRHGNGPHNGVDLVIVRNDDSHLLYEDTDIHARGRITQPVVFPAPGHYRVVIDAYPQPNGPNSPYNFQLLETVTVAGTAQLTPPPPPVPRVTVDGYRFTLTGQPALHAIQPAFLTFTVTDPQGNPAVFTPWRGALAHAIFIRQHSLDYFHTHVCPPGATNCTARLGAARVAGTSSAPGRLKVGLLVPVPGIWRLFLLSRPDGTVVTAPFTLHVS
jgi:hypothetical protein